MALLLLQLHLCRRLAECSLLMRFPVTSRMHIVAYVFGLRCVPCTLFRFSVGRTMLILLLCFASLMQLHCPRHLAWHLCFPHSCHRVLSYSLTIAQLLRRAPWHACDRQLCPLSGDAQMSGSRDLRMIHSKDLEIKIDHVILSRVRSKPCTTQVCKQDKIKFQAGRCPLAGLALTLSNESL